jgi:hypothetical protein
MTVGMSSYLANALLNGSFHATTFTAPTTVYAKLHTGDPGAAGTANASAVTTRNAVAFNAASAGAITMSSLAGYSMTATETITHISVWDASSAGNFLYSIVLTASQAVVNGNTLNFTSISVSFTPIAA